VYSEVYLRSNELEGKTNWLQFPSHVDEKETTTKFNLCKIMSCTISVFWKYFCPKRDTQV